MLLTDYIDKLYEAKRCEGRNRFQAYLSLRNSIRQYLDGKDVGVEDIDAKFIMGYYSFLRSRVSENTVSYYMRNFRRVMNQAKNEGLSELDFDWGANVSVAANMPEKDTTEKALSKSALSMLVELDLTDKPLHALVRDMFMFSFYARGIELYDLGLLKKTDLTGNILRYRKRQKGNIVEVYLGEKCMSIISRYNDPDSPYLLPILRRNGMDYQSQSVKTLFYRIAREIGDMVEPKIKLSFSISRASWQALVQNINIAEIAI